MRQLDCSVIVLSVLLFFSSCSTISIEYDNDIFKRVYPETFRVAQREAALPVADQNGAIIDFVILGDAAENELVTNAIDWINHYVRQQTNKEISIQSSKTERAALYVGFGEEARKKLKNFRINEDPGPQGFVLKQSNVGGQQVLCCWSPTALGCRYGLIEFLRSLETRDGSLVSDINHIVDAPDFPVRIHYVNFAEHMLNSFNVNTVYDTEIGQWSHADWEKYIDMISAYKYNKFEFWLAPTLFGRDNEQQCEKFIQTINYVIAYAKRRGVSVHPVTTVNTLGARWFFACPNDPNEKKQIIDAWDFWSKSIQGNDSWGIFPCDPGGCIRNGCTKETFIDLSIELSAVIQRNNPKARVEIMTWYGLAGWGEPIWSRESAERSMEYLIEKLSEFPQGTYVSINRGFDADANPDNLDDAGGGDARPYAKRASALVPVLSWDYTISDTEETVFPHCHLRQTIETRIKELEDGCYSGGITWTLAPQLQSLQAFCSAETWWNPHREAEDILKDYSRLTFGEGKESIGLLLEEFEVIPQRRIVPPFPYSADRLAKSMARLLPELEKLDTGKAPRLPLSIDYASYVKYLVFFAILSRDLADVSMQVDAMNTAFQKTALTGESQEKVSLADVVHILATKTNFDGRDVLEAAAKKLKEYDVNELKKRYWDNVYSIYDHTPVPADPRTNTSMALLSNTFQLSLAEQ